MSRAYAEDGELEAVAATASEAPERRDPLSYFAALGPAQRVVLQRKIAQRRAARGDDAQAQGGDERAEAAPSGGGGNLPDGVRGKMEHAFGTDFSDVRVHEGGAAAEANALAFTQGSDIHFAPGRFDPSSQSGQSLLGHELAHVVQQREGRVAATTQEKGLEINDDDSLEREADDLGARAARGEVVATAGAATGAQTEAAQRYAVERAHAGTGPVQFDGFKSLEDAIKGLSEQARKHICVEKHQWGQVIEGFQHVAGEKASDKIPEGMWEKVEAIMIDVAKNGTEMVYKGSSKKKVMAVNGKTVEVTFVRLKDDSFRVSDAWVASGGEG